MRAPWRRRHPGLTVHFDPAERLLQDAPLAGDADGKDAVAMMSSPPAAKAVWPLLAAAVVLLSASLAPAQSGGRPSNAAARPAAGAAKRSPQSPSGRATLDLDDSEAADDADDEGQARTSVDPAQPRPIPRGYKLSPEMSDLLTQWEAHTQFQRLSGKFVRYDYSSALQIETRAVGDFWYEAPDRARMDFRPADLSKLPKTKKGVIVNPSKVGPDGNPFEVQPANAERWVCDGAQVLQISDSERNYSRAEIPPQQRGASIIEGPLPFVFGLKKSEAQQRYLFHLGDKHAPEPSKDGEPGRLHIVISPLRPIDAREWSRVEVLLNPETFLPKHIRVMDPAGSKESVYSFFEPKVDSSWGLRGDPFKVNLSNYQIINEFEAELPTADAAGPPRGTTRPAGASSPRSPAAEPEGAARGER